MTQKIRHSLAVLSLFFGLVDCAGLGGPSVFPSVSGDWRASVAHASTATAAFTIVVPPANASMIPGGFSPATRGVGIAVRTAGAAKAKQSFFVLSPSQQYCTGGGASDLTCRINLTVAAGRSNFVVDAYAGTLASSSILATGTTVKNLPARSATPVPIALGGVVTFLQIAVADAFPVRGKKAAIPVLVTAADAGGYPIAGAFDAPIVLANSDASGVTRLSQSQLRSASDIARLVVNYTGAKVARPASIEATTTSKAEKPQIAETSIEPGANGIVAAPGLLTVASGGSAPLQLAGPGTKPPFAFFPKDTSSRGAACKGRVLISGSGAAFTLTGATFGDCELVAADNAGHTRAIPVFVSMPAAAVHTAPTPSPTPSPEASPLVVSPTSVTICPSSGASACNNDAAKVSVSQPNYFGTFSESDTCAAGVAKVAAVASSGPAATFTISGQSTTGTCRATFTGAGGQQSGVAIIISPKGIIIDALPFRNTTVPH